MRILYIEDDTSIAEIYSVMIKDQFPEGEITHFENGLKALQELKHSPEKYNLVISDFNLPTVSGGEIFSFVNSQMLGIPFIILSSIDCTRDPNLKNFFNSHVRNALLLKPATIHELAKKIEWCLNGEDNLLKIYNRPAKNLDEKIAIRSDTFLKINTIPCDIYLKLHDGKFIKIINRNELFESKFIQKLILKNVNYFFVNQSELSTYGESVLLTLHGLLKLKKYKNDETQKSQVTNKAIEILKANLHKCGFNNALLQITDDVTELQIDMINNTPELSEFLSKFQTYRKLNTEHSRLVSYIIVGILKELKWDSESSMQKMCTAALLHDFSLPEGLTEKVVTDESLNTLSDEERSVYLRHPEESSHVARNFEKIAVGIEQYILEHHELPNGKGFPKNLNFNNVHPLSATLHLATLTADLIWKFNFDLQKVRERLEFLRPLYLRGFYRKPYEALLKSLKLSKS